MTFRYVQHLEVVVVPLNFWPLDNPEPHGRKGAADLPDDLGCRMEATFQSGAAGKGHVQTVLAGGADQCRFVDLTDPFFQAFFKGVLSLVRRRADGPALVDIQRR